MNNNIIFIGDSFCASTDQATWQQQQSRHQVYLPDGELGYPSLVAKHYDAQLHCFGYSGKSWWYSYSKYQKAIAQKPTLWDNLIAIVFCHTDPYRINSSNEELTTRHRPEFPERQQNEPDWLDRELGLASEYHVRYLHDHDFQSWAQQQYFKQLKEIYGQPLQIQGSMRTVKTLHFHSFVNTLWINNQLPGHSFTTPLNDISRYEFAGTDEEFHRYVSANDDRANHLNTHNNQALAQVIIDSVDHYAEGESPINLSGFDQPHQ